MCTSANTFDYFVGVLALISTLVSIILYHKTYLPGTQIKLLFELLAETKAIYQIACADGLLPIAIQTSVEMTLSQLDEVFSQLRGQAYRATTPFAECLALFTGLSRRIMQACGDVKKLRSLVLTVSEEERLRQSNRDRDPIPQACDERTLSEVDALSVPLPRRGGALELETGPTRPHSCPPSLDYTPCFPMAPDSYTPPYFLIPRPRTDADAVSDTSTSVTRQWNWSSRITAFLKKVVHLSPEHKNGVGNSVV